MANIAQIQLPSGDIFDIKDGRIPIATTSDEGKIIAVDSSGDYIITDPQTSTANAYVTNTTLFINTSVQNGDGVSY